MRRLVLVSNGGKSELRKSLVEDLRVSGEMSADLRRKERLGKDDYRGLARPSNSLH